MSTNNHPTYFSRRANARVPNMAYSSEVDIVGTCRAELGAPNAASATAIMNATSIATALTRGGTLATYDTDAIMGKYGRNVTVILSGAGTPVVTVYGRDYLGQPMSEQITATGAVSAVGLKAFRYVDGITTAAVGATTLSLGTGTKLGLPYAIVAVEKELMDNAAATAGTFVAATSTAQTATSTDPRGTYLPNSVPNAARDYVVIGQVMNGQLHGVAHYAT